MKMYKTGYFGEIIQEVEPLKISDKSVWFKDGRISMRGTYTNYFHTIEEAKSFLEEKYKRMIITGEDKIAYARNKLEELKKY